MIGLDTNVLVGYVAQDDPDQSPRATELIEGLDADHPGFVSLVVLAEVYWVLRRAYRLEAARCADIVSGLLNSREVVLDQSAVVALAIKRSRAGADFADALIVEAGRTAGCDRTVTFDRRAGRTAGMDLLPTGDAKMSE